MAFIVGDACVKCKLTDCVEVCPVDCFYEGPNMLVINPDECIDCALCEPECPIEAIYSEDEVPEDQIPYIELNAELCMEWPNIVEQKNPLPDSDEWKEVKGKFEYIERIEISNSGFVNIFFQTNYLFKKLKEIFINPLNYGNNK